MNNCLAVAGFAQSEFEVHLGFPSTHSNAELLPFGLPKPKFAAQLAAQADRPALEKLSDEALIAMLRDRGHDAIGCLFRRHAKVVHSIGKRVLGDAAEAEDLVQEVFLYLFRRHDLYDSSKSSARSWLIQIAYTQAFLRRRKLKSLGLYENPSAGNRNSDPSDLAYDHTVEGLFGVNGWKKIAEELTPDQRETFKLHFFEGYTFGEIAEKLGQSYANVRNHHYRGLEKLRKCLAGTELNRR